MNEDLGEKDERKQKIKNKISEKHNFLNTKIKEISKLKINNSYLHGIEEEYKLYHQTIVNNNLKIFPIPTTDKRLFFEYIKTSERDSVVATTGPGSGDNLITDISNVPYANPTYSNINAPGRYWIFEYTLALAAETLGLIRGKYTSVPIPGAETTLNQADLLGKSRDLQVSLIEKLRTDLDESSRKMQLERKAAENAAMTSTLQQIPMNIFIG
jgi:hypothetical protein